MRQVSGSMANVVKGMDGAMKTMNLEKISMIMEKFEGQFEDLDVATQYYENATSSATAVATPQEEVDRLMGQVADSAGLELGMEMPEAAKSKIEPTEVEEDGYVALLAVRGMVTDDVVGSVNGCARCVVRRMVLLGFSGLRGSLGVFGFWFVSDTYTRAHEMPGI